jgi:hypothetical protein
LRRAHVALILRRPTRLSGAVHGIALRRKRRRFRGSCDSYVCTRGLWLIGANLCHRYGTATVSLHRFDLLRDRSRRRRRSGFCDYIATSESRRRTNLGGSGCASKTARLRSNCGRR